MEASYSITVRGIGRVQRLRMTFAAPFGGFRGVELTKTGWLEAPLKRPHYQREWYILPPRTW